VFKILLVASAVSLLLAAGVAGEWATGHQWRMNFPWRDGYCLARPLGSDVAVFYTRRVDALGPGVSWELAGIQCHFADAGGCGFSRRPGERAQIYRTTF